MRKDRIMVSNLMDNNPGGNLGVVLRLIEKMAKINEIVLENIPFAYPIGTVVYWEHGHHTRSGTVDMHTNFGTPRLRVMLGTGNFKWIGVSQILRKFTDHDEQE